jgi:hypothetical protein
MDLIYGGAKVTFSMNKHTILLGAVSAAAILFVTQVPAQYSTPPPTPAEKEATYTTSIEKRTEEILKLLALSDTNNSAKAHDIIIAQYRALRSRDDAIDAMLEKVNQDAPLTNVNRSEIVKILSKALHDQYLTRLSAILTPDQVEVVKDKMTYNKVKVTSDAYCAIVSGLTDADKVRILTVLKEAREEAMDGGNAGEKTAIFQKYKDRINEYLGTQGHDVAKATKEWEARQELAKKAVDEAAAKPAQPAN